MSVSVCVCGGGMCLFLRITLHETTSSLTGLRRGPSPAAWVELAGLEAKAGIWRPRDQLLGLQEAPSQPPRSAQVVPAEATPLRNLARQPSGGDRLGRAMEIRSGAERSRVLLVGAIPAGQGWAI